MPKYREDMPAADLDALNAELAALDAAYAAAYDSAEPADEEWEDDDPVKMGWVDKNGRP
jgi:hypothetical protein